jgi:hypothetical protein
MPDELHPTLPDTSPFELVFEEHPGYFFACVEGDSKDPAAINDYQTKIAAEISRTRYDRVMIKRDIPISNNAPEHFSLIYKVRAWEMRKIKFAFVDVNPEHLKSYDFALLFARSHGIEAEVFGDVPTAKKWLLAD